MDIPRKPSGLFWLSISNLDDFREPKAGLGSIYKLEDNTWGLHFFEVCVCQGQLRRTSEISKTLDQFQSSPDLLEVLLTTRPVCGSEQMRSGSPPQQTSHPLQMEFMIAPSPARPPLQALLASPLGVIPLLTLFTGHFPRMLWSLRAMLCFIPHVPLVSSASKLSWDLA